MNLNAFFKITYGLYIVTSKNDEIINGHISNTVFQVTAEPPQFAVCTNKDNLTTDLIKQSGVFAVSIIEQDVDINYIGHFGFKSGKDFNKFQDVNYKIGKTGAPIVLDKTAAYFECEVVQKYDVGSHIIFIGKVIESEIINESKIPLTYNHYRNVIKGVSPKNSPTYIDKSKLEHEKTENKSENKSGKMYKCTVCGYVYEPEVGDAEQHIKPGTAFEDLPDNWICPVCGATKDMFEELR
ncbi:MAG: flavin reductase [Ignavibacteriae bacterium]|nr:flavin reductase [Ignavibacteriota bacterium]